MSRDDDQHTGDPGGTEIEDSNPNAAGPQGLRGDMGVSSERAGDDEHARAHPREPAEGPEMDDTQQEATQRWRDEQPPASEEDRPTMNRAAGESNTAQVPGQDFDPKRNPGHSHA